MKTLLLFLAASVAYGQTSHVDAKFPDVTIYRNSEVDGYYGKALYDAIMASRQETDSRASCISFIDYTTWSYNPACKITYVDSDQPNPTAAKNAHPRFPCVGCAVDQDHHPDLPCTDPNWVKTGTCVVVDPPQSPITSQSIPADPAKPSLPCFLPEGDYSSMQLKCIDGQFFYKCADNDWEWCEIGDKTIFPSSATVSISIAPAKPYDLTLECKSGTSLGFTEDGTGMEQGMEHLHSLEKDHPSVYRVFVQGLSFDDYFCWEAQAETKPEWSSREWNVPTCTVDWNANQNEVNPFDACPPEFAMTPATAPFGSDICVANGADVPGVPKCLPAKAIPDPNNNQCVGVDRAGNYRFDLPCQPLPKEIPFCGYSAPGEDCVKLPDGFQLMPSLPFNAMPEAKP